MLSVLYKNNNNNYQQDFRTLFDVEQFCIGTWPEWAVVVDISTGDVVGKYTRTLGKLIKA